MLELPPLMTNKQIHRERAPQTATFPASFPRGRPEGRGYSLAVDDGALMEWKGEEIDLPLPVLSVLLFVFVCGYFVWLSKFLDRALFSITCLSQHLSSQHGPRLSWEEELGSVNTALCCLSLL